MRGDAMKAANTAHTSKRNRSLLVQKLKRERPAGSLLTGRELLEQQRQLKADYPEEPVMNRVQAVTPLAGPGGITILTGWRNRA